MTSKALRGLLFESRNSRFGLNCDAGLRVVGVDCYVCRRENCYFGGVWMFSFLAAATIRARTSIFDLAPK